jgi:hypothetical protein
MSNNPAKLDIKLFIQNDKQYRNYCASRSVEAGIKISISMQMAQQRRSKQRDPTQSIAGKNREKVDEIGVIPRARDGSKRADVGNEIVAVVAARDEPDGACSAALEVHGHHRLGAGVPHDDLGLTLRAEQGDVLASPEAAALEVPSQSPRDGAGGGAAREVEAEDDDDFDAGVHARGAERALHLAELPVGPLHHLDGRGDEFRAAREGLVAEERAHCGAPEGAAECANPGAWQDGFGAADPPAESPRPSTRREGLEGVNALGEGKRDDDVVVAVKPLAAAVSALGVSVTGVEVENDDDGGVALGSVVAFGGWETLAGQGSRVGGVGAAEADEAPGGGERDDGLIKEGGEGGVRNRLLGIVVAAAAAQRRCGGVDRVEGGVSDVPVHRVVEEARERPGQRRGWRRGRVRVLGVRQRVHALGVVGVVGGGVGEEELGHGGSGGVVGLRVGAGVGAGDDAGGIGGGAAGGERDGTLVVVGQGGGEDEPFVEGVLIRVHGELDRMGGYGSRIEFEG